MKPGDLLHNPCAHGLIFAHPADPVKQGSQPRNIKAETMILLEHSIPVEPTGWIRVLAGGQQWMVVKVGLKVVNETR